MRKNINKTDAPKNDDLIIDIEAGGMFGLKLEIKMNLTKHVKYNKITLEEYLTTMIKVFLSNHVVNENKKTLES